jgi:hypothetical protein
MQTQPVLSASEVIVETDRTMTDVFRTWTTKLSHQVRIVNAGNPEGIWDAPLYSEYIDSTVPLSPVRYLKMLPEVSGDTKKGWAIT